MQVHFTTATPNTGSTTLNVSGLGALQLRKAGQSQLVTGDILASTYYVAEYDGTRWQLLNPSTCLGASCVVTNGPNAGTSAMTLNMSASNSTSGFIGPTVTGVGFGANGVYYYSSPLGNLHVGANGLDNILATFLNSTTIVNNDCTKFANSAGNITLTDGNMGACVTTNGANTAGGSFTLDMHAATGANP